jgi:PucR C-terminal helix-turn-helix domain
MAKRGRERTVGPAAIVARIPLSEAAAEIAAELTSEMPAFAHLSEESRAEIVHGLRRSTRRWSLFLSSGSMPPDGDFDPLREWTRTRAAEGVRLEDLLRSFGLAHQVGWRLLRRHARPEEASALLDLAAPLAAYIDQVSAIVTETYLAERELLVSEEERRTRSLLDRLSVDAPLGAADSELADRLGVPLEQTYAPFAVAMAGRPPHSHATLASRLRRGGWRLAVTNGDCVVGLTWKPLDVHDLGEGADVVLAIGEPTPRAELAAAREEIVLLAEYARRNRLLGRIEADEHLLEILLARSPELLARLRARVLAPLADAGHAELTRTLHTLIDCRLDRTAASAALHVHRNTLAYRLKRVEELTGLDLTSPRDLACAYIAFEQETDAPARS